MTFAEKIINFNKSLEYNGKLPEGVQIMNPFKSEGESMAVSSAFYRKYYNDSSARHLILGINPGRFGAGVTGIPFTDSKRLRNECGLEYSGNETHETSAVFVYDVIEAYGGPVKFYNHFYINSVCPLGFTISDEKGRVKNYNYYDSTELTELVQPFIIESVKKQIAFGINTDVCFCFGTGKNEKFLRALNDKHGFFGTIIALEHPRFVMQYKAKSKQIYIDKYINAFDQVKRS
ncbi:MAG: DUF4918 family protein [Lentimicrobium sp.]|jgi:hypothetical protein|nr:DUF4918 family protein [Lentimicrobium sp.]